MIVNKELNVSNRKKAVIVAELRENKFRPFPKIAKAKAAGETEEALEDEEEIGSDNDYDYLLGMPIWSLTREKVHPIVYSWCEHILTSCSSPLDRETRTTSGRQGDGATRASRAQAGRYLEY
jgi:hypothetical protein